MVKIFQRTGYSRWQGIHLHHNLWADSVIHFHRKENLTDLREDFDHHHQKECHHQLDLSGENIHRMEDNSKTGKWEGMAMEDNHKSTDNRKLQSTWRNDS